MLAPSISLKDATRFRRQHFLFEEGDSSDSHKFFGRDLVANCQAMRILLGDAPFPPGTPCKFNCFQSVEFV